ncbi:hypothetical protein HYPSUDRAFT_59072 [Hypholoma sublateritium FD-334 SS-4]|uniref:Brl1/Brr6 domain-containing protein n=1 Tax=Hypholoma sublateritium (strain FD-334 SS-4) TaxID=945553 RepID=A0A0D2LVV9_HYPSF|nr:hypothetical protein HYPSUDRAFT_59072 [Hypholoma sublateritium FD-334 SS-4]
MSKFYRSWFNFGKGQSPVLAKSEGVPVEEQYIFRFTKPLSTLQQDSAGSIINNAIDNQDIIIASASGPRFPTPSISGIPVRQQESSVPKPLIRSFQPNFTAVRKSTFDICVILVTALAMHSLIVIFDIFWNDVNGQSEKHSLDIHFDALRCSREYADNQCDTRRIPGTAEMCLEWEKCMNEGAAQVIRMRIIASLVAGFIEDFIRRLSYRTLAVLFSFVFSYWLKIKIQG